MVRATPESVKRKVIWEYVTGHSYREISEKHHMGQATIASILKEARQEGFDLELLREFCATVQKPGLDLIEAMHGISIMAELEKLGVGIDSIKEYVELCKSISTGDLDPATLVKYALKLQHLEQSWQIPPEAIIQKLKKAGDELVTLAGEIRDYESMLGSFKNMEQLQKVCATLRKEIAALKNEKASLEKDLALVRKVHAAAFGQC